MKMNMKTFITILVAGFVFGSAAALAAPKKPAPPPVAAPAEISSVGIATSKAWYQEMNPKAGLFLSPTLPMGDLGEVVSTGMASFHLFAMADIPKSWMKTISADVIYSVGLNLRTGLRVGFSSFGSPDSFSSFVDSTRTNDSASVTIVPILIPLHVGFPVKVSQFVLTPYATLGFGITAASMSVTSGGGEAATASSMDGTLLGGAGASLGITKDLDAYLEINYLLLAEEVSGNFLQINLGASYRLPL